MVERPPERRAVAGDADVARLARQRRARVVAGAGAQRGGRGALDDQDVDLQSFGICSWVSALPTGMVRVRYCCGSFGSPNGVAELALLVAAVEVGPDRVGEHRHAGDEQHDRQHRQRAAAAGAAQRVAHERADDRAAARAPAG